MMREGGRIFAIQAYCEMGLLALEQPHTIDPRVLILIKALLTIGKNTDDLPTAEIVADAVTSLFDAINGTGDYMRGTMNWLQSYITAEGHDE